MRAIALLHFHPVEGPVVHFMVSDSVLTEHVKDEVSHVLNLDIGKNYFLFRFDDHTTYNYQFTIDSDDARGGSEYLMLSMITDTFPLASDEAGFKKAAMKFELFIGGQPGSWKVFHLDQDYPPDIMGVVEDTYADILGYLRAMMETFSQD